MTRKVSTQIVDALKNATPRKLSERDTVERNGVEMVYFLWYTWIVKRNTETGVVTWNESNFSWRGSRTTQSRFRDLRYLLER